MKQIPIIPLKSQFYLVSVYANGVPGASNCNNLAKIGARKCSGSTAIIIIFLHKSIENLLH